MAFQMLCTSHLMANAKKSLNVRGIRSLTASTVVSAAERPPATTLNSTGRRRSRAKKVRQYARARRQTRTAPIRPACAARPHSARRSRRSSTRPTTPCEHAFAHRDEWEKHVLMH
eukprot:1292326-Pleurochrysis_carterae.AAC.1